MEEQHFELGDIVKFKLDNVSMLISGFGKDEETGTDLVVLLWFDNDRRIQNIQIDPDTLRQLTY